MPKRLTNKFYQRDTETVARELLGCSLVHVVNGERLAGRIIETEAYLGAEDQACHTFGDRRTERTKSMYLAGGHAYVYFIYGMHFCFNVVTRTTKEPEAVLIRAIEPTEGLDEIRKRRGKAREKDLANGPGKLCQALGITKADDGLSLTKSELFIEEARLKPKKIHASPRVGVDYAGEHAAWLLRFQISDR